MINYNFNNEDIKKVERFIEIKNKGMYCDGAQITDLYNRVLGKRAPVTNCGSCLRARVSELETALNHYKAQKSVPEVEVITIPQEENKAAVEAQNEDIKTRMAKVRAARKNSKK